MPEALSQEQISTGPSLEESQAELDYSYQLEVDRAQQRMADDEEAARMEEESKRPVPMSWLLFLPLLIVVVVLDIIDMITGGTIGWVVGIFGDLLLLAVVGISKSGRKQFKRIIIGLLGDSVPIIAFLPIRTIFLIWAFMSSRSEKLQAVGQVVAKASLAKTNKPTINKPEVIHDINSRTANKPEVIHYSNSRSRSRRWINGIEQK